MRASLPKFASNNRLTGTPEEYQAVVQGSMAYFGTYKVVSEKEHLVSLHMEASTFANWEGEDMTRVMVVVGDEERVLLVPSGERSLNLRAFQRGRGNRLPRPLLISRSARRISLLNQNIPRSSAARTPFL
jgi:hypothetical protein